jgi:hypothetical protein
VDKINADGMQKVQDTHTNLHINYRNMDSAYHSQNRAVEDA